MNPESPINPRQALESSLTALLLGELPPDQAEFLHRTMTQDPELAKTYERLKRTIELVQETAATPVKQPEAESPPLKMSEDRRQELLQHFKTAKPREFARPRQSANTWVLTALAAVLIAFLGIAMLLPALSKAKSKSKFIAAVNEAETRRVKDDYRYEPLRSRTEDPKSVPATSPALSAGEAPVTRGAPVVLPPETSFGEFRGAEGRAQESEKRLYTLEEAAKPSSPAVEAPANASQELATLGSKDAPWNVSATLRGFYDRAGDRAEPKADLSVTASTAAPVAEFSPGSSLNGLHAGGYGGGGGLAAPPPVMNGAVEEQTRQMASESAFGRRYGGRRMADGSAPPAKGVEEAKANKEKTSELAFGTGITDTSIMLGDKPSLGRYFYGEKKPSAEKDSQTSFRSVATLSMTNAHVYLSASEEAKQELQGQATTERFLKEPGEVLVRKKPARLGEGQTKRDNTRGDKLRSEVAELGKQVDINENLPALKQRVEATDPDLAPKRSASPALPEPQPEIQTRENAFSTFSLNVSEVSFKLAAASLEQGVMPEPATIRSEEFINAFDYRDPEPPAGVPVAFAWERASYPFAQNRDLLRFSLKTAAQGRQPGRPLNLVLLLDNSGSMERSDRIQIIREALRVLAAQLQAQDTVSVVAFARTARLWVDGVPGTQAAQALEQLGRLTPQGGTNLEDAMNLAYQTALRHYVATGINRVVLLTDGAANLGTVAPETLKAKVEAHRKQGIALDCFGIGWEGYQDDLLESLTRNGDGRYGFINSPEEAASGFAAQLAGALQVAASDVKVQVEFNPNRVTAYRQVGYAKHQLTKEQFRDNTVDAAEIGAAESGNALYVIQANPRGQGPLATVRVRYKMPGTLQYHEHEWAVPYTGNAVSLEQSSTAMRLAAVASAFSESLSSSPYAAEVRPDALLSYLRGIPEVYGVDTRPKRLEWMIRQAKSITGK